MEPLALPDAVSPEPSPDFAFAFNDVNFSDRILRIEIIPDFPVPKPDPDVSLADWSRNRKRPRDDELTVANEPIEQCEEHDLNCNVLDLEEAVAYENQEEEAVTMVEESPLDAETTLHESVKFYYLKGSEELSCMDHSAVQVKTLHISSPILAAKSPFFYKLFSNGTKESEPRYVTLRIQASAAFMDLLNFMYSNTLPRTPTALLDVLMAADKFEVASCMRFCSRLLRDMPMTCESALLYLDLPSTVLMSETVQPLMDAARKYLATRFKDLSKCYEEALNLPLVGIEAVLLSDDLHVASEDAVYDFLLKWAQAHYSRPDQRREILSTRLLRLIRFPSMTCRKLKKVLACSEIEPEVSSKLVLDALFFKTEAPYRQRALAAHNTGFQFPLHRFVERAYKYRPVKVVEFGAPHHQCVVYLDLRRDECAKLFPSGRVYSQAFHLGGHGFFLSGHCDVDQNSSFHCFGLFLGMQGKRSSGIKVDYDFSSRMRPTEEFVSKYKGNYTLTGGKAVGFRNLFGVTWTAFLADESPYFVEGVLHLRVELTVRRR
ncbi:BTB/POZ domain-containing protein [Striga hermonthica]|uniref:BTB/POZ domain-containing protein n=1 Tax=Striga hermonthica TaxID=68872 RepID=A0A9N7RN73_STRHE|nr:BTB/POZ domain-containing protein [Striga hermonthica]